MIKSDNSPTNGYGFRIVSGGLRNRCIDAWEGLKLHTKMVATKGSQVRAAARPRRSMIASMSRYTHEIRRLLSQLRVKGAG